MIVSWVWQAGGVASRSKPLVGPEDAKGMKVRGGSREMDMMFKDAGASVLSLPSNEIYAAMQTGAMDAALTSSTSLISFRLEEVRKCLTSGRGKAYWFMLEPLMMSKIVFDKLPKEQQDDDHGCRCGSGEVRASSAAKADDQAWPRSIQRPAPRSTTSTTRVKKWQALARNRLWKDYAGQERKLRQAPGRCRRSCCERTTPARAVEAAE